MEGIADYTFVRALGAGNHGQFYLARPPSRLPVDAEYVAVKVMDTTTSEAFRRATRELRAFAAVRSAYLVRLFDAGQQAGTFYYAMEYLPLGSLMTPARPLSREEKLRAVTQAALAAHDLHEAGMVHRDIKPANVLVTEDGARLSDLGLAQVMAPGQTITGMGAIGSVEFIDPAILRGRRPSRATDVYSLGVTLHHALTGVGIYGPLPQGDPLLALRRVLATEPRLDASLSPEEAAIVARCLDPDPDKRPLTAAEAAADIGRLRTLD